MHTHVNQLDAFDYKFYEGYKKNFFFFFKVFLYPSVTLRSGVMVSSNWHKTPITQLLFCQCPTSLFNSLFVENGVIIHIML